MSSNNGVSTCEDIKNIIKTLTIKNDVILKQYDKQKENLQKKKKELTDELKKLEIPNSDRNNYPSFMTVEHYACEGERHEHNKSECNNEEYQGYPAGSYEWTGYEEVTGYVCPCCRTKAECKLKQSFVDNIVNDVKNKRKQIQDQIDNIDGDIKNLKLNLYDIPDVACCQSIEFNNLEASNIYFDNLKQSCSITKNETDNNGQTSTDDKVETKDTSLIKMLGSDTNTTTYIVIAILTIVILIVLFIIARN